MEMIIFTGIPGSGKSTFYKQNFQDTHVLVSKDLMGNKNKPHKQRVQIEEALKESKSIVVDNTNVTKEIRAELIELGKQYSAKIIGYYFESIPRYCLYLNSLRTGKAKVPDVVIYKFNSQLEPQKYSEGFDELFFVRIDSWSDFKYEVIKMVE